MNISKRYSNRIRILVFITFIIMSTISLADANSDAFAQVFKEGSQGGGVIERMVNALYYGLIIIYRGVSVKISQLCGALLLMFMTLDILRTILQEISRVDIYAVFKMILPKFVKNLVVAFILVTPTTYPMRLGLGTPMTGGQTRGTLITQLTEMLFTMFYRLGLLFFNDNSFSNVTPGKLADIFFTRPLKLLQEVFGFMSFFAIFTNIVKILLLLVCLWICGKIIAIYVANIFMALILTTFSVFYLIFLTMESTQQIGQKGVNIIIVQSVTLFMTVAMMGISYQVMNLLASGSSVQGIASMAVVLLMLQQTMENVGVMAMSVTSGGGLGTSNGAAFLGLSQAAGMAVAGVGMLLGAKADELTGKKSGEESSNVGKDALKEKGRANVGASLSSKEETGASKNQTGLSYNKNKGLKENMKSADESMNAYKKQRSGYGVSTALLGSAIIQAMTKDFSSFDDLKSQKKGFDEFFNRNNAPYDEDYIKQNKSKALDTIENAFKDLVDKNRELNIGSGATSMNEGLRRTNQNSQENKSNSDKDIE